MFSNNTIFNTSSCGIILHFQHLGSFGLPAIQRLEVHFGGAICLINCQISNSAVPCALFA
jgi:hypothetical protein